MTENKKNKLLYNVVLCVSTLVRAQVDDAVVPLTGVPLRTWLAAGWFTHVSRPLVGWSEGWLSQTCLGVLSLESL